MPKSFIERLTDEQIASFLERVFPKKENYECSFRRYPEYIYASATKSSGGRIFIFKLYDFDTFDLEDGVKWIKYLYEIFGEEYKQAFLSNIAKIFD